MLIEKYVLHFNRAVISVGERTGTGRLNHLQMSILYCLKRQRSAIGPYMISKRANTDHAHTQNACTTLTGMGLIDRMDGGKYIISAKGREFLGMVRRYLLNIRL